ncbi:MAG: RloB family protein [Planctomycetota bacterium]
MKFQRTRLLDRTVNRRDARIFLVATEGERTEPDYFRGLQERELVDRSRVHIEVVPTPPRDGTSAPNWVLERLVDIEGKYRLEAFDQRWLVFDRDTWTAARVSEVATQARQRRYDLAVSTPCFELWLILHVREAHGLAADGISSACKKAWGELNPGPDAYLVREVVQTACDRAQASDPSPEDRWAQSIGTHVYRLVKQLLPTAPA